MDSEEVIAKRKEDYQKDLPEGFKPIFKDSALHSFGLLYEVNGRHYFRCLASEKCANDAPIVMSHSSSHNGWRHMKDKHDTKPSSSMQRSSTSSSSSSSAAEVSTVAAAEETSASCGAQKLAVDMVKMIIKKDLPFDTFEGKDFLHCFHPEAMPISRQQVRWQLVDMMSSWAAIVREKIKGEFASSSSLPFINMCIDEYSHKAENGKFLGVRVFYLDRKYCLQSLLLAFVPFPLSTLSVGSHGFNEVVKHSAESVLEYFGIALSSLNCICCDTGSDFTAAVGELASNNVCCFSRLLARVVSDAVSNNSAQAVKQLVQQMKDSLNRVMNAKWSKQLLSELCEFEESLQERSGCVENGWRSLCAAMGRFLVDYEVIVAANKRFTLPIDDTSASSAQSNNASISALQVQIVQIYSVLRPLDAAIAMIAKSQQSSTVSLMTVVRMLRRIKKGVIFDEDKALKMLKPKERDAQGEAVKFEDLQQVTKDVIGALKEALNSRFFQSFYLKDSSRIIDLVIFFHPKYKLEHLTWFCDDESQANALRIKVLRLLQEKMERLWKARRAQDSLKPTAISGKKRSLYSLVDDSESDCESVEDDLMKSEIEFEAEAYNQLVISDSLEGGEMLEWWKNQATTFPLLSEVARSVLATPASQQIMENDACFDRLMRTKTRAALDSIFLGIKLTLRANYETLPPAHRIPHNVTKANFKALLPKIYLDPFYSLNEDIENEFSDGEV
eukprot:gene1128-1232_t